MTFKAEEKKIRLILELDQSHPYIFRKIYGDRRRYLQILLNFISNSLKFTQQEGSIIVVLKILEIQSSEN